MPRESSTSHLAPLSPIEPHFAGENGNLLGRMSIDKQFHGPLNATSTGEILSVRTNTDGSAGYVAMEQVTGTLDDRQGSFVLHHFGVMSMRSNRLILEVVPDSGTGDLTGLTGAMSIDIRDGKHFYEFDYDLN